MFSSFFSKNLAMSKGNLMVALLICLLRTRKKMLVQETPNNFPSHIFIIIEILVLSIFGAGHLRYFCFVFFNRKYLFLKTYSL